jgi:hypothetical protein
MNFRCVSRNKTTQACPESFGYVQDGFVEGEARGGVSGILSTMPKVPA